MARFALPVSLSSFEFGILSNRGSERREPTAIFRSPLNVRCHLERPARVSARACPVDRREGVSAASLGEQQPVTLR